MDALPVLRALKRNKTGAILICLQIALTLAIVSNSLFIIQQFVHHMQSPTGLDEDNIFIMSNAWVVDPEDLADRIKADLAALRSLPGVIDAEGTDTYPLLGYGWGAGLGVTRDQRGATAPANRYFVDEHGLSAYGLHLLSGRWFYANEVGKVPIDNIDTFTPVIVVTEHLATQLFPAGNALGQVVYFNSGHPTRIIGIVGRVQSPSKGYFDVGTAFLPLQFLDNGVNYLVRTVPGQQAQVMHAAPAALYRLTHQRVIQNLEPFAQKRHEAYQEEHTTTVMLVVVCALLLAITVFGIVGLTLYWVTQRRRAVGMRRALGARRQDILSYFHTENLLIATVGCILGMALGLAANAWLLMRVAGLTRMNPAYIGLGALLVLGLSQAAVLWPALRAASVPPAVAMRGL